MGKVTEYRKLVRDNLPKILEGQGLKVKTHEADSEEYEIELLEKLREEAIEFKNAKSVDELVDLLETLDAIKKFYDWHDTEIDIVRTQKFAEKGGYSKRLILEQTEE